MDDLTYGYQGNKLLHTNDNSPFPPTNGIFHFIDGNNSPSSAQDYYYDNSGNIKKDLNKGISNDIVSDRDGLNG